MADRWNMGKPSSGDSFAPGFVTAWDERKWPGMATMQTIPFESPPSTMAEQMDGDQNVTAAGGK